MTLGSHQKAIGSSQVHITPKWIIDALGPFDFDPCAAMLRPWNCAQVNFTEVENGLAASWHGFIWLNPPFDRREVHLWVDRMAAHDHGIALLHARTETAWFLPCWKYASAMLFLDRRIAFCRPDGTAQPANSGAPPVLVAFGSMAYQRLNESNLGGAFVEDWTYRGGP